MNFTYANRDEKRIMDLRNQIEQLQIELLKLDDLTTFNNGIKIKNELGERVCPSGHVIRKNKNCFKCNEERKMKISQ